MNNFPAQLLILSILALSLGDPAYARKCNGEELLDPYSIKPLAKAIENPEGLGTWEARALPGQSQAFDQLRVVKARDPQFPLALYSGSKRLFRLQKKLGDVKHGSVFLTEDNRAITVLKDLKRPRALLTQVWANRLWRDQGIDVPDIYEIDPLGNYLVQEYIEGPSLLAEFSDPELEKPRELKKYLNNVRRAAAKIASATGLYFDIRASNFFTSDDGRRVFVECGPSFDEDKAAYTELPNGRALPKDLFFEYFFYRQIREEALKEAMQEEEQEINSTVPSERILALDTRGDYRSQMGRSFSQAFSFVFGKKRIAQHADLLFSLYGRPELENWATTLKHLDGYRFDYRDSILFRLTRARLKRVRFGFEAYSRDHKVPANFDRLVKVMGWLRDAQRKRNKSDAKKLIEELRELLKARNLDVIEKELASFKPASKTEFTAWINAKRDEIAAAADAGRLTGHEFHDVRKTIGVLLSVAEASYAIEPSLRRFNALLFFRTLTARMGDVHDRILFGGSEKDYETRRVEIPEEIREALIELRNKFLDPADMTEPEI